MDNCDPNECELKIYGKNFKLSNCVLEEVMGIKDGGDELSLRSGRNDYEKVEEEA